jgi:hypothetical protein
MKASIIFCSEFSKKYPPKIPVVSCTPPVIPALPEVVLQEYTGKRRGRKPGSKKIAAEQRTFRLEEREVMMEFL